MQSNLKSLQMMTHAGLTSLSITQRGKRHTEVHRQERVESNR